MTGADPQTPLCQPTPMPLSPAVRRSGGVRRIIHASWLLNTLVCVCTHSILPLVRLEQHVTIEVGTEAAMGARRPHEPRYPFVQFDRIYDLYRDCILNQEYYGHRLSLFGRIAFWLEVTIVLGSGASGVSGWIIWTKYPASAVLWGVIAAASTLLAALKPVLQTDTKLKRYSTLFSAYRQLAISMKMVVDEIGEVGGMPKEIGRDVDRIRARYRVLAVDDDPRPSLKLVKRLQEEINKKIPPSSLFYPPFDTWPDAGEAPVSRLASDADGMDVKVDSVVRWPYGQGET
jgi:hypothetical protein